MAIVTISRGSYSRGKEVAEKLAQKLGYECISRDILLEASDEFNIPEIKLIRAPEPGRGGVLGAGGMHGIGRDLSKGF